MCTLIVDLNCKGLLEDCLYQDAVTLLFLNLKAELTVPFFFLLQDAKLADYKV